MPEPEEPSVDEQADVEHSARLATPPLVRVSTTDQPWLWHRACQGYVQHSHDRDRRDAMPSHAIRELPEVQAANLGGAVH